jgi:hypothetical protein
MKKIAYIVFFLLSTALFAQKVTTSIDTTRIKIGAEFKLTLKTSVDTSARVVFPKLKNNHLLAVPLTDGPKPPCVYFTKEVSRQSEIIDMSKIL